MANGGMPRLSAVVRGTHLDKALSRKSSSLRLQPYCRRLDGELIKSLLEQANWRPAEDVGNHDQDRPRVFGYARWRKDWVKVSSELAQDRRA